MPVKLQKKILKNEHFNFNAILFMPENPSDKIALFTHGYTASKSDCLNWAQRLSEADVTTVIFDLPGHHLGSFNEVESFEVFTENAHKCFLTAFEWLKTEVPNPKHLTLGGHSLGALLSVLALEIEEFSELEKLAIGVGLGIGQHKSTHLFETTFYERTLNIRRQLVDPNLDSDLMFPWIKQKKLDLDLTQKRIHLITGVDDVVVGEGGMEALAFHLRSLGNDVTTSEPRKLPHHEPSGAATHIYNFLKKEITLS